MSSPDCPRWQTPFFSIQFWRSPFVHLFFQKNSTLYVWKMTSGYNFHRWIFSDTTILFRWHAFDPKFDIWKSLYRSGCASLWFPWPSRYIDAATILFSVVMFLLLKSSHENWPPILQPILTRYGYGIVLLRAFLSVPSISFCWCNNERHIWKRKAELFRVPKFEPQVFRSFAIKRDGIFFSSTKYML